MGEIVIAVNAVKAIAEYLGLIKTVSSDVQRLIHAPLRNATNCMENAELAPNDVRRIEYVKEAVSNFRTATSLETDENLISAYVGLSICQYYLGEPENAQATFDNIKKVELSRSEKAKAIAMDVAVGGLANQILNNVFNPTVPVNISYLESRKSAFKDYKTKAIASQPKLLIV